MYAEVMEGLECKSGIMGEVRAAKAAAWVTIMHAA
jgi:hypothetical protein